MSSGSDEPLWYCVKTQPKREHFAARHLRDLEGVEVFCPRLRYRKATRRGKVWWVEALFPGYIMARFVLSEMVPAVPDRFVEILRAEVGRHAGETGEEETLTVAPRIEAGEEIEIASGPLGGFRGEVVAVLPGRERVKVLLEFLGEPHVVEVDLFTLLLPRKPLP